MPPTPMQAWQSLALGEGVCAFARRAKLPVTVAAPAAMRNDLRFIVILSLVFTFFPQLVSAP